MPYNAQYARDAYQYFKGRGICVECHQRKAINGRVKCEVCTERRAEYDAQRDKDALRRKAKERADRLKAQGICRDCGKRPVKGNSTRCADCLRLNCLRTKQKNAEKRIRKPQGICRRRGCMNEVVNGMKTCAVHYPEMVQAAARMRDMVGEKVRIDFNQGLDARLIDNDIAELLSRLKWIKFIRMSCDTDAMLDVVTKAVDRLTRFGVPAYKVFVYLLVQDIESAERRAIALRNIGVNPFAQPYRDFTTNKEPDAELKRLARWVNHKAIFKSVERFKDYK